MGIATDFVLIVVAGFFGGALARWLRLPLLVGYVAAGIVVGPHTAGPTVTQIRDIEMLAEVGVALLLFSLGLEISLSQLAPVRRIALLGGSAQLLMTLLGAAAAAVAWMGLTWIQGIWFGAMVSLSSTMVTLKTMAANGSTASLGGRIMLGWLVLQDLAVVPLLVILPQVGRPGSANAAQIAQSIGLAAILLLATAVAGSYVLPPLLARISSWGSRELFLVAVVAVGIGVGYAVHAGGLSFALGAFIAGLALSESEFSHQALNDVAPLRDVFGLLFFVTVGMLFDPLFVARNGMMIATVVVAVMVGKALIVGGLTRLGGYSGVTPWVVGLGLAQIGEFSFVLAREALQQGAVAKPTYDLVLSVTVLTMAISPMVANFALPLARLFAARPPASPTAEQVAD